MPFRMSSDAQTGSAQMHWSVVALRALRDVGVTLQLGSVEASIALVAEFDADTRRSCQWSRDEVVTHRSSCPVHLR